MYLRISSPLAAVPLMPGAEAGDDGQCAIGPDRYPIPRALFAPPAQ